MRSAAAALLWAGAAVSPEIARAQPLPSPLAKATMSSSDGPRCRAAMMLDARAAWRGVGLTLVPAPVSSQTRYGAASPAVVVDARSSVERTWRVSLAAAIGRAEADCLSLSQWSRGYAQLARVNGGRGVALALGGRSLSALDPSRDREGATISLWQQWRAGRIGFAARGHGASTMRSLLTESTEFRRVFDPLRPLDTGTVAAVRVARTAVSRIPTTAIDLVADGSVTSGRVLFDFSLGGTFGRGEARVSQPVVDSLRAPSSISSQVVRWRAQFWARAQVQAQVTPSLHLGVGLAALPTQPLLGSPARGVLSLSVGFAHRPGRRDSLDGATAVTERLFVTRADSGHVEIRMRLPSATAVLLSGDPTHWRPVPMTQRADGWWDVRVTAVPGFYRVNISIDGAGWTPPPGVPSQRDEFGGLVGVITVR